jgi:hypothetical protein
LYLIQYSHSQVTEWLESSWLTQTIVQTACNLCVLKTPTSSTVLSKISPSAKISSKPCALLPPTPTTPSVPPVLPVSSSFSTNRSASSPLPVRTPTTSRPTVSSVSSATCRAEGAQDPPRASAQHAVDTSTSSVRHAHRATRHACSAVAPVVRSALGATTGTHTQRRAS